MIELNMNGGPIYYKAMQQTYLQCVQGRIEPTEIRLDETSMRYLAEKMTQQLLSQIGVTNIETMMALMKATRHMPHPHGPYFNGAKFILDDTLNEGTIWFHNPEHPEVDAKIINIRS